MHTLACPTRTLVHNNNNNNKLICIKPHGRNFRGPSAALQNYSLRNGPNSPDRIITLDTVTLLFLSIFHCTFIVQLRLGSYYQTNNVSLYYLVIAAVDLRSRHSESVDRTSPDPGVSVFPIRLRPLWCTNRLIYYAFKGNVAKLEISQFKRSFKRKWRTVLTNETRTFFGAPWTTFSEQLSVGLPLAANSTVSDSFIYASFSHHNW